MQDKIKMDPTTPEPVQDAIICMQDQNLGSEVYDFTDYSISDGVDLDP